MPPGWTGRSHGRSRGYSTEVGDCYGVRPFYDGRMAEGTGTSAQMKDPGLEVGSSVSVAGRFLYLLIDDILNCEHVNEARLSRPVIFLQPPESLELPVALALLVAVDAEFLDGLSGHRPVSLLALLGVAEGGPDVV